MPRMPGLLLLDVACALPVCSALPISHTVVRTPPAPLPFTSAQSLADAFPRLFSPEGPELDPAESAAEQRAVAAALAADQASPQPPGAQRVAPGVGGDGRGADAAGESAAEGTAKAKAKAEPVRIIADDDDDDEGGAVWRCFCLIFAFAWGAG